MAEPKEVSPGITTDPMVMAGKPVIKGTRIPVELILAKASANPDLTEIFADYPELTEEDIDNCFLYEASKNPIDINDYPDLIPIVDDSIADNRRVVLMKGNKPLVLLTPITKQ